MTMLTHVRLRPTNESATCKSTASDLLSKLVPVNEAVNNTARRRLRVLIADDTAAIRDSLSALIARLDGVEIVGLAETGSQALELIRSLQPDVATLDIRMPGVNGINVLEAVRREKLKVTVIILTGLDEAEYRRRCFAIGADYFFHKATEFESVIDVLKQRVRELHGAPPASASGDIQPALP